MKAALQSLWTFMQILAAVLALGLAVGIGLGVGFNVATRPTLDRAEKIAARLDDLLGRFLP